MTTPLEDLDARQKALWTELLSSPAAARFLSGPALRDRRAYAVYLTQAYHYTSHTPANQTLVSLRPGISPRYRRYCLQHAQEEVGHEHMALHDLRALGVKTDPADFPMLPATELKIAYLYWLAEHANPVARLGYSFWAEDSYAPGGPVLTAMRAGMGLTDNETTFFTAHARVDAQHREEVRGVLTAACKTPEDWAAVARAAEATIRLTFSMLEQELEVATSLIEGEGGPFDFLNVLA